MGQNIKILQRVGYWDTQFGLVIGFINNLEVVTTITYNTVTQLTIITRQSLYSICCTLHVFITWGSSYKSHWITDSQFSLHSNTHKVFNSHLRFLTGRPPVFFCSPGSTSLASATSSTVDLFGASGIQSRISPRKLPTTTAWVAPGVFKITSLRGPQKNRSPSIVGACLPRSCIVMIAARTPSKTVYVLCSRVYSSTA
jgi:hypothetical protein